MGAGTRWQRSGMFAAALLLAAPDAALACSMAMQSMSRAQIERYARAQYAEASAVVDAEVIEPMVFAPEYKTGLLPMAVLQVIRRYKGVQGFGHERIPLIYFSSCDISPVRKGERVRILLTSGPELFRATFMANGPSVDRQDAQAEFNAEIDRLVGTPRPADFSTYPGADVPPPEPSPAVANNSIPAKKHASLAPVSAVKHGTYLAGALGLLLTFLAGVLVGNRRKACAGTA